MVDNQFETLGRLLDIKDTDRPGADSLYAVSKTEGVARGLSFILFDEIVESSPVQSRDTVFDPEKYPEDRELLESIQKHGITQPVVVRFIRDNADPNEIVPGRKLGERKFALVAGHRRVAAGRAAGLKGTEGVLARSSDDHEMITWAENMGRRELSSYEKSLALKSLQERRELSGRKTAEETGISQTYVNELFIALSSPVVFRNMWKEGNISSNALVTLKEHWGQFDKVKDTALLEKLRGLSQADAKDLRDQLSAGTDLKTALMAMGKLDPVMKDQGGHIPDEPTAAIFQDEVNITQTGQVGQSLSGENNTTRSNEQPADTVITKKSSSRNSPASSSPADGNFNSSQKKALVTAIRDVFPKISGDQGKALFDYAIVNAVEEVDVVWAAALYLSRGGKLDKAIELSSEAISKPKIKSLINREVKHMKQISSTLKRLGKKDKNSIFFLKKIFPGS